MRNFFVRASTIFVLSFVMVAASVTSLFVDDAILTAQAAPGGSQPMFSWGDNNRGRLGRAAATQTQRSLPGRVGELNNWVSVSTAAGGSYAINSDGELFAWGERRNQHQMGQGATGGTANLTEPTRIGTASNWVHVSSRNNMVIALNSAGPGPGGQLFRWGSHSNAATGTPNLPDLGVPTQVGSDSNWVYATAGNNAIFAINTEGELWAWGQNQNPSALGLNDGTNRLTLTQVAPGLDVNWATIATPGVTSAGFAHVAAITDEGHLYTWGNATGGRLGNGGTGTAYNRAVPTRITTPNREWASVAVTSNAALALTVDGHIYAWGPNQFGVTGQGTATGNTLVPTRVGTAGNWVSIHGGQHHTLAFNADGELWAWGLNTSGQLGVGGTTNRTTPALVDHVHSFSDAAVGGGTHTLMLMDMDFDPVELDLEKRLRKPEGTPIPTISFTFEFEAIAFNDNPAQAGLLPSIPDRVVNITPTSPSSTAGGITTTIGTTNILENISFPQAGIFSYRVTEMPNSSNTTSPSSVTYSQAEYELRIYVAEIGEGLNVRLEVAIINIFRVLNDDGSPETPPLKVHDVTFANIYRRTTTGTPEHPGALTVSKTVIGEFANRTTPFDFEVTLIATALCPSGTTYVGRILNHAGTQVGSNITFTSGSPTTVTLLHGQRLIFDGPIVVGTRFVAIEQAAPDFIASVDLIVNGNVVTVPPNIAPNTPLSTDLRLIGVGRNSAAFNNACILPPLTGLGMGNSPLALAVFAVVLIAISLLIRKARRGIEELSLYPQ